MPLSQPRRVETRQGAFDVLDVGAGPAVLFLHGWPESARAWRHQLTALAQAGFRALAYDQRGYGDAPQPAEIHAYGMDQLVGDAVAVLDALDIPTATVVGHDWGAPVGYHCALLRPDRFVAVAGLSVPYAPRGQVSLAEAFRRLGVQGFYILHFQQADIPEAEFDRDVETSLRRIYYGGSGDLPPEVAWSPVVTAGGGLLDTTPQPPADWRPSWLPPEELAHLADSFRRSGFRGGLNWYRNIDRNWRWGAFLHGAPIRQPSLFIAGARDGVIRMPGHEPTPDRLARAMPNLRGLHLIEGTGHWVQQEAPDEVNAALLGFLQGVEGD